MEKLYMNKEQIQKNLDENSKVLKGLKESNPMPGDLVRDLMSWYEGKICAYKETLE